LAWEYWFEDLPQTAAIVDEEKVNDFDCYVIQIVDPEKIQPNRIWIKKSNYQLVKSEVLAKNGEKRYAFNSNFKKLKDDFEYPWETDIYTGNTLSYICTVKSIEIDKGLSDDLFDVKKYNPQNGSYLPDENK
jgi:hypothetical protein